MYTEWLEWLKLAPMAALNESLSTRERLYYDCKVPALKEVLRLEMAVVRAEIARRNGK